MIESATIYVLCDPKRKAIRYVGKSEFPEKRYAQHIAEAKKPVGAKSLWIAGLIKRGEYPSMLELDRVNPRYAEILEMQWLRYLIDAGYDMTNKTRPRKLSSDYSFGAKLTATLRSNPIADATSLDAHYRVPAALNARMKALLPVEGGESPEALVLRIIEAYVNGEDSRRG